MANRNPSNDDHEARMPASPEAAEATTQPGGQTSSSAEDVVPLFDIIDTVLGELPTLREVMPPRSTRTCLMSDSGKELLFVSSQDNLESLLSSYVDHLIQKEYAVLIIENFDANWFQALAARFPASLNVRSLAEHAVRQGDLKETYNLREPLCDEYRTLVSRVDAEISRRLSGTTARADRNSQHVDGLISRTIVNTRPVRYANPAAYRYRREALSNFGDSQRVRKTSTRLSFCRVHKHLTLALVDAGPESVGTLQVNDLELWPADVSGHVDPLDFVMNLFRHYTVSSVLARPMVYYVDLMLSTAAYQALVPNLEVELLKRRRMAAQSDNERAFSMLTEFRRGLTSIHQSMAKTSGSVVRSVRWSATYSNQGEKASAQFTPRSTEDTMVDSTSKDAAPGLSPTTGLRRSKPADLSKLSETFSELDVRLRAIIAALNDDIQIVIGSVQIQDAKTMKRQADLTMQLTQTTMRQTEVSVRQTRWTVALAILAAFYLPMTLVTGIYGMNIVEISGDKGPNWWWVVVTWAVIMGVTMGSVSRYALAEWRWYRRGMQGPEVAVNQESTDGVPGAQDHGTGKSTGGEVDDVGCLSIRRWRRFPPDAQYDGTRSTV